MSTPFVDRAAIGPGHPPTLGGSERSTKPRRLARRTVAYEKRDSLEALAIRPPAADPPRVVAFPHCLQQGRHARLLIDGQRAILAHRSARVGTALP